MKRSKKLPIIIQNTLDCPDFVYFVSKLLTKLVQNFIMIIKIYVCIRVCDFLVHYKLRRVKKIKI